MGNVGTKIGGKCGYPAFSKNGLNHLERPKQVILASLNRISTPFLPCIDTFQAKGSSMGLRGVGEGCRLEDVTTPLSPNLSNKQASNTSPFCFGS